MPKGCVPPARDIRPQIGPAQKGCLLGPFDSCLRLRSYRLTKKRSFRLPFTRIESYRPRVEWLEPACLAITRLCEPLLVLAALPLVL